MSEELGINKITAELSEEMDMRKRQWRDLARTYEQFRRRRHSGGDEGGVSMSYQTN